jgi:transcriptional regulator with XRE-family HTH domain
MKITNLLTDDSILTEFGQRLAGHRLEVNMTQAELAVRAGVSKSTVENLERGASGQMSTIIRILRVLNLMDNLDRLVPEPGPKPIELLKQNKKVRIRASRKKKEEKTSEKPWAWKEDK